MSAVRAMQPAELGESFTRGPVLRAVAAPRRGKKPRIFYALVAVATTAGILLAQLALSILLAQGSYQIADLQQQSKELGRSAQSLQEQLANYESPQYLAQKAAALGMHSATSTTYLTLSDGSVSAPHKYLSKLYADQVANHRIVVSSNLVANSNLDPAPETPVDATGLAAAAGGLEQALNGLTTLATEPVVQTPPMEIVTASH